MVNLRHIGQRLAAAAMLESPKTVIQFIKKYIIPGLLRTTPGELSSMIKTKKPLWDAIPQTKLNVLRNAARARPIRKAILHYLDMVTPETVIQWMLDPHDKPYEKLTPEEKAEADHLRALVSVIVNYPDRKGIIYLEAQTATVKANLVRAVNGEQPVEQNRPQPDNVGAMPRRPAEINQQRKP